MNEITRKAYAKINIALDVTGKRADGYHLVDMVMQTVGIHDLVTVKTLSGESGKINLTCSNPAVPLGSANIAYRAALAVMEEYGIKDGVSIHIEKNIPMAAGMAGGSTDAAAVISAMNEMFDLQMTQEVQDRIALKLGADVPFCLRRGTWRAQGIGEALTKLPDVPPAYVLVIAQDREVSTKWIYETLDSIPSPEHPDIEVLLDAIYSQDIRRIAVNMGNILEAVTLLAFPFLSEVKETTEFFGAEGQVMTGSGPTVFALFTDRHKAQIAMEHFNSHPSLGRAMLTGFVF